jgi:DNA-binding beta-propeller fold protein YncE
VVGPHEERLGAAVTDLRVPCPACGAPVLAGARKCRSCKTWIVDPRVVSREAQRLPRAALIVGTAVAAVLGVLVTSRESPVGEAPPLTALASDSAAASASAPPPLAFSAPDAAPRPEPGAWRAREILVGDVHPLDVAFHPSGESIYVSGDDATLREYLLKTGELVHKASVPAQGDRIRLLFDRYIAVLRRENAARIPVLDTTAWDVDPRLLEVGKNPGDIVELPDGRTVLAAAADGSRVSRFDLPSGTRLSDITLAHATGQLFLVRAEGRPYVAAMGALSFAGRPGGAWIDLFDPDEVPFGATRRSIPIGRDPTPGAVMADGGGLFFADRVSNTASLLRVAAATEVKVVPVGQAPEVALLLNGDRHGVTLNGSRSATVIDLSTMRVVASIALDGEPRDGVVSPDASTLFVALGGLDRPPKGSGACVLAGDPPKVVASLPTGKGAIAVAVSKDGSRAAVASYFDRSITLLER